MIAEFVTKPYNTNRNQAGALVRYIYGATKDCAQTDKDHTHTGLKEKIHFIGCSDNMCIVDPLHTIKNGKVFKLKGDEADLDEIIKTFDDSESKNQRSKFPLEHIVLSLPEYEQLTIPQWLEAVQLYINEMGYENCTWTSALHEDILSQHAHIALCNISNKPPHNSVNPSNKFQLSAAARTKTEGKFGLSHTVNPFEDKVKIKNPNLSKNQIKNYVRVSIDEVMEANPKITLPQFQSEMMKKDVGVFASLKGHETQIQGMSFSYAGTKMKASQLGKGYKTKDLIDQGLNYEIYRDLDQVKEFNEAEKLSCEMLKAHDVEIDKLTELLLAQEKENANSSLKSFRMESSEITRAMSHFSSEYYVVALMSQDDIEATYQNNETHSFSTLASSLINASYQPVNRLCSIAIDPRDKYGIKAQKAMASARLRYQKLANERIQKKMIKEWMKILMMLLSPAKPSCYNKKRTLPRRGYDLGPLNSRFDNSSVIILNKREMATMLYQGQTIRVMSNVEHKTERFVALNKRNKLMFIDRKVGGGKVASYENELSF